MRYEESLAALDSEGFQWRRFRDYFPFGDLSLREGNYQRLLDRVLSLLPDKAQQEAIVSLLDAQACVFLEQLWVQQEQTNSGGTDSHFVATWLQINSNLRSKYGLLDRDPRGAMLKLKSPEMLIDRILWPHQTEVKPGSGRADPPV